MKRLLLLLIVPILSIAQIPTYYNSIDFTQSGSALKNQLTTLITSTHVTEFTLTIE